MRCVLYVCPFGSLLLIAVLFTYVVRFCCALRALCLLLLFVVVGFCNGVFTVVIVGALCALCLFF